MTTMRLQPASLVYSMADSGIQADIGKMVHQPRITHTRGQIIIGELAASPIFTTWI
ncbi:hypothetical protein N8Z40_02355 [Pseudomonadales bacterium]|jgi:hypothetical protein|nr:hypothetical protein [Pseudomonadales bacterium]MDC1306821.1 hypothetical protein [Pseudomonadales bacterium]